MKLITISKKHVISLVSLIAIGSFGAVGGCADDIEIPQLGQHTSYVCTLDPIPQDECDGTESYTDENGDTYTADCGSEDVVIGTQVESCAECDDDPPEECGGGGGGVDAKAAKQKCIDDATAAYNKKVEEIEHDDAVKQDQANKDYEDCCALHADEDGVAGCYITYAATQADLALDSAAQHASALTAYGNDLIACRTGLRVSTVVKPVRRLWGWVKKLVESPPEMGSGVDPDAGTP